VWEELPAWRTMHRTEWGTSLHRGVRNRVLGGKCGVAGRGGPNLPVEWKLAWKTTYSSWVSWERYRSTQFNKGVRRKNESRWGGNGVGRKIWSGPDVRILKSRRVRVGLRGPALLQGEVFGHDGEDLVSCGSKDPGRGSFSGRCTQ